MKSPNFSSHVSLMDRQLLIMIIIDTNINFPSASFFLYLNNKKKKRDRESYGDNETDHQLERPNTKIPQVKKRKKTHFLSRRMLMYRPCCFGSQVSAQVEWFSALDSGARARAPGIPSISTRVGGYLAVEWTKAKLLLHLALRKWDEREEREKKGSSLAGSSRCVIFPCLSCCPNSNGTRPASARLFHKK